MVVVVVVRDVVVRDDAEQRSGRRRFRHAGDRGAVEHTHLCNLIIEQPAANLSCSKGQGHAHTHPHTHASAHSNGLLRNMQIDLSFLVCRDALAGVNTLDPVLTCVTSRSHTKIYANTCILVMFSSKKRNMFSWVNSYDLYPQIQAHTQSKILNKSDQWSTTARVRHC